MDIIQSCLSLTPVPCLGLAFSVFRTIWTSVQQVQASKEQLLVLAYSSAQLLNVLDTQYRARRLLEDRTSMPLHELSRYDILTVFGFDWCFICMLRLLNEISVFIQKQSSQSFVKSLCTKNQRITEIERYHKRINITVDSFQASPHFPMQKTYLTQRD
jgi:hypothetical protein